MQGVIIMVHIRSFCSIISAAPTKNVTTEMDVSFYPN